MTLKILFISHKYPPSIGGMERHAAALRTRLEAENQTIIPLIYDNQEGRFNFFRKLESRAKAIIKRQPDIDLIYINEGLLACFAAQFKRWTQIPIVATVHGLDIVFPNPIYQYFIKKQLAKLDGLIAVSKATAEACKKRGLSNDKLFAVNNGVDHDIGKEAIDPDFLQQFEAKHQLNLTNKKILVTMGRPVKRKGFSWFVEKVMPSLSKDTIFILIGPRKGKIAPLFNYLPTFLKTQIELAFGWSNEEATLKKAIQLPANKNRVFEVGKLPFADVNQLLKIAHLFIMPNREIPGDMEGFGLVALETAINKTPAIAAGIEGIKDAIQDGKNGYLLTPECATIWVKKIKEILAQPTELEHFSQQAKSYTLQTFSWKKMATAYKSIFLKLAKQKK